MWYAVQTLTGREKVILGMMEKNIEHSCYRECFFIRRECAIKREGVWEITEAPLFPGYVFVDTDNPEEYYRQLKRVPKLTKLLRTEEGVFLAVSKEEQSFLESIQSEEHLVRRSLVRLNSEKQIIDADGAVGLYLDDIVKQRLRKRFVLIQKRFLGKERRILLGIKLSGDREEEGVKDHVSSGETPI